ncbi:hypothetical protein [uncultured Cohaesibacter sp.]|uniref:hypothetical protein n=1 Tax=uncultured Cohaesibacter sp. TaxID=1002546 RepID=UPI0029C8C970|nr:hypothetical protein [uncultured Cohaesibacter sp.]
MSKMPFLPYRNNPTIDKYFMFSVGDLVQQRRRTEPARPIQRLGPNLFAANGIAVLIRYANDKELRHLEQHKYRRCYYLIDDDLKNLDTDDYLPIDYRFRLQHFHDTSLSRILELATDVITPNQRILTRFPDHRHHLLNPSHPHFSEDLSHFDKTDQIRILYSGTRSHYQDLELVSDVLSEIAAANPAVQITTFFGRHAPAALKGKANIVHRKQARWPDYQKVMATERFHLALAPLIEANFNLGRSVNKILDHAAFGAAGCYSSIDPIKSHISDGINGFLVPPCQDKWLERMKDFLKDPKGAKMVAAEGIALARKLADPQQNRAFWTQHLDLG